MSEPLTIVPGKSDKELAEEFKKRAIEIYAPYLKLVDEAL